MILPSAPLNDPDSAIAWVSSMDREARHRAALALLDSLFSAGPAEQRISAAYALNRVASLGARSSLILAAFDLLPAVLGIQEKDIRRAGLVAISSLVHGARPATAVKLRGRLLERSYALARPKDAWDADVLISIVTAVTRSAASGPGGSKQVAARVKPETSVFAYLKRYKRNMFGLAKRRFAAKLRAELEKRSTKATTTRGKAGVR